jgi:hypothetical protein
MLKVSGHLHVPGPKPDIGDTSRLYSCLSSVGKAIDTAKPEGHLGDTHLLEPKARANRSALPLGRISFRAAAAKLPIAVE